MKYLLISGQNLTAALILFFATAAFAADPAAGPPAHDSVVVSDKQIEALLAPIREKYKVPGLVAGIVQGDKLTAAGAVGLRKAGATEPIMINDKLHLGSNTKALTATLLALLVEEKMLSWQATVGEIFPHLKDELHADFIPITLEQLLTHRAGLPADGPWWSLGKGTVIEQRDTLLKTILGKAPLHRPGTKFLYSNVGYVVAGHFAEQATGKSWEDLVSARLFEPLHMTSAGFGVPGTLGQVDQPWGHRSLFGVSQPLQVDNAPALGPAGTVHCSLPDWAKFVVLHLQGARGSAPLLKPETFKILHTPPAGEEYALGWGIVERPWAKGRVLAHSGSNTMWFATVWIAPERDIAFLAVANQGMPAGQQACDATLTALIELCDKSPAPAPATAPESVTLMTTPAGVRFGILGTKPAAPAPTLFVFANDIAGTLESADYNQVGRQLSKERVLCVSLDLPCHGRNVGPDEPRELDGWAARLRNDEDFISAFTRQASAVLDDLIAEGYTDRERVMACGTSRGGFIAIHFAAAEPRIACVAAFAPVTDLTALREFNEFKQHAKTKAVALESCSHKLAGRPIWLCIGNHDERVDTDRAIAFTRAVVKASLTLEKPPLVEMHIMTSTGHTIHPTAHDEAAAWFAAKIRR